MTKHTHCVNFDFQDIVGYIAIHYYQTGKSNVEFLMFPVILWEISLLQLYCKYKKAYREDPEQNLRMCV